MLAVIKTGGKQYLVEEGQELSVEKLDIEEGKSVTFDALLTSDVEAENTQIGAPVVSGAKVTATILEQGRAEKVSIVKYKAKSRYRRRTGHRQPFTKIKIEKITA